MEDFVQMCYLIFFVLLFFYQSLGYVCECILPPVCVLMVGDSQAGGNDLSVSPSHNTYKTQHLQYTTLTIHNTYNT